MDAGWKRIATKSSTFLAFLFLFQISQIAIDESAPITVGAMSVFIDWTLWILVFCRTAKGIVIKELPLGHNAGYTIAVFLTKFFINRIPFTAFQDGIPGAYILMSVY